MMRIFAARAGAKWITAFAAVVLAVLLAGCNLFGEGFDPAIWAAERGNYDGESRRAGMAADLDEAGVRVGAGRDFVRSLLGPPDATGPEGDLYYLGRSRVGPSYETFRIDYDAAGKIHRARSERT